MNAELLQVIPDEVQAVQKLIAELDQCFLQGFVGGKVDALMALSGIFYGTPLEPRIQEALAAFSRNEFFEPHFVSLAAARAALQAALYDMLQKQGGLALGRTPSAPTLPAMEPVCDDPLLSSTRHWLMELAITGLARLDADALLTFGATLAQLRAKPGTLQLSSLLTGFLDEILETLPIKDSAQVPLLRWCDLWSTAMLYAVGIAPAPSASCASGTLFPLGVEMRQQTRAASLVVYSVLVTGSGAQFVHHTWSAFKVAAIQDDECWLLFPEAQTLLKSLSQRKSLLVNDAPYLPSGAMLWQEDCARTGKKFNPFEIAAKYLTANLGVPAMPPLERHPVQIAEPVAFEDCKIESGQVILKDGSSLPIDAYRNRFSDETLAQANAIFGLLRFDAGAWMVQPLTVGLPDRVIECSGQEGMNLLKKPPTNTALSILQERASRLLRK